MTGAVVAFGRRTRSAAPIGPPIVALLIVTGLLLAFAPGRTGTPRPRGRVPGVTVLAPPGHRSAPSLRPTGFLAPTGDLRPSSFDVASTPTFQVRGMGDGLAVDDATQTGYVTDVIEATIQSVNLTTGRVIQTVTTLTSTNASLPVFASFDPKDRVLFVGTISQLPQAETGTILVLSVPQLRTLATVRFPGAAGNSFVPTQFAWDPATDQLFTENLSVSSNGSIPIAVIDAATDTVTGYLSIPPSFCPGAASCGRFGLAVVGGDLVVGTGTRAIAVFWTANDTLRSVVPGRPGSIAVLPTANGSTDAYLVNDSGPGFLELNLTTLSVVDLGVHVSPRSTKNVTGLLFDATRSELVMSDSNSPDNLTVYRVPSGPVVAHYENLSEAGIEPQYELTAIALDPSTGEVVTTGTGLGSTLLLPLPSLGPARVLAHAPLSSVGVAADPNTGRYFLSEIEPDVGVAVWEGNGSVDWETRGTTPLVGVAVDPTSSAVWFGEPTLGDVVRLSETDGTQERTVAVGPPTTQMDLAIDPTLGRLYVVDGVADRVSVINLTTDQLLTELNLPSGDACDVAVDSQDAVLFVSLCSSSAVGNISVVSGESLRLLPSVPTTPAPIHLAWDGAGTLYVSHQNGPNISVVHPFRPALPPTTLTVPGTEVGAIAVDAADASLFALAENSSGLALVQIVGVQGSGVSEGALNFTGAGPNLLWDPSTSTLLGGAGGPAISFTAHLRGALGAPRDVTVAPENNSVRVDWSPPSFPGAAPTVYSVGLGVSENGTFASNVSTNATNASVAGLTDGRTYFVQVRETNGSLLGPAGLSLPVTPVGVPYPPESPDATVEPNATAVVRWSPPASDDGSPVVSYIVEVSGGGNTESFNASPGDWVNVTGLATGSTYSIVVFAVNAVGEGHASVALHVALGGGGISLVLSLAAVGGLGAVLVAAVVALHLRRRARQRAATGEADSSSSPASDLYPPG